MPSLVDKPRYLVATVNNSDGSFNFYLVPSNSLSSPLLTKVAQGILGYTQADEKLFYFGSDTNRAFHLYSMALDDPSVMPVPQQIGSLSLSSADQICYFTTYSDNQNDPATFKFMVRVAGTNQICGDADDVNEIIGINDGPSVVPVMSAFQQPLAFFRPLYSLDGVLVGAYYFDQGTNSLYAVKDADFSQVSKMVALDGPSYSLWFPSWNYAPIYVLPATGPGLPALYRTSLDGGSELLYTAKGIFATAASDSSGIYFSDDHGSPRYFDVYKLATSMTSQPVLMLSEAIPSGEANDTRVVLGSTGANLVVFTYSPTLNQSSIKTVPTNTLSSSLTKVRTYDGPLTDRFMYFGAGADQSQSDIVVTRWDGSSSVPGYSSEVFRPDGTQVIAPLSNTLMELVGAWDPKLIVYADIADTDGNYGGASINDIDLASGSLTPYKLPDGSIFKIGTGQIIMFDYSSSTYGVANMGYPSPYGRLDLDYTKAITPLLIDFVSHTVYTLPYMKDGNVVHYM